MRGRGAAALVALVLLVAGCGGSGGDAPAPDPQPSGTGYYVGGQGGIGASVDLHGEDGVQRAVARALAQVAPRPVVGIVSVVNDTPDGFEDPRFVALLESGRAVILEPAATAVRRLPGAAAREARTALARIPGRVPPRGATVLYVVMDGAAIDDVASVVMAAGPYPSVALAASRR